MNIPARSIPVELQDLVDGLPAEPFKKVFDQDGNFKLGPIPKGFPINLAANYQPRGRCQRRPMGTHEANFAAARG